MTGGTTDISVIEIKCSEKDGKEEIHIVERACGGAFGGVFVNEKFIQWLNSIFGKETMKQFKIEHRSDYMSLIANFEEKKRLLDSKGDKPICVQIPQFLKSSAEKGWGCSLEEYFAKLNISDVRVKKRGKLFLPSSFLLETCFLPIAKDVFDELQRILTKHGDIDCVVAVGGLAQSPAVVSEIRKYGKDIPVYVPFDSSLAVVSGAVLYGHDKNVIKARVCPYSYGIQSMRHFIEGKDDESKKVKQEGETWCKHTFRALYKAGDLVRLGEVRKYDFMESFTDGNRQGRRDKPILCIIFASRDREPRYVTDPGCHEHGTLSIDPPNTGFPDQYECTVGFEFAGTEIIARIYKENRIIKTVKLDFLN